MVHVKKKKNYTTKLQLRALATHRPILGHVGQGALESRLPQTILEWPLGVCMYLLRKGAYRHFLHIILKHTQ